MATLALAAAGAAAGSALLPTGLSVLGATITGATIGSQIGALAGSFLDQALFAPSGQTRSYEGPRLSELRVTASTEGAPIPRLYGRARLGGQVIWATDFEEDVVTTTEAGGSGKGSRRASASAPTRRTEYRYFANFAVALAEGAISGVQRVWADGRELDLSGITYRLYLGSADQEPDALIVAREGADNAPAYRGLAYIVFERLALADFGNRLPQLSFEVHRAVDAFDGLVRAVVVIPGSGEFVYDTDPVTRIGAGSERIYENVHTRQGGTDWTVGIDQLEQALPNARTASLVVSWFGTDLRAGHCEIKPGVEIAAKDTYPAAWSVAGLARADAHLVSTHDDRPAYGGTPSDRSVLAAIADLEARDIGVMLTPFVLMDIAQGNTLPDPWTGAASQPAYPWRGRITCDPAPGQPGSPDKTAAAATQIAALVGTAAIGDFAIVGGAVVYSGPDEWTLRRQVLHYAWLAKAAGGVDAFCIGSELKALTSVRNSAASYPFVAALVALASDVKTVLPDTQVTYAADWSEYFGHQPQDGTGDVFFHLDPLWASPDIDAIGVDLYWPLADWRSEPGHLDAIAGARSPYDLDYLKSNLAAGEGYDWYYASDADRQAQVRTPITDGAGKPWVFRYKDMVSWWSNAHYHRPGGVEAGTPTTWVAQSKPIWLTEVGCPAVDKGANQPNAFVDPKSAESTLPYFSDGRRDDLAQRRYLQAILEALDPDHPASIPGLNPNSTQYAGTMIDLAHSHVYAWDARPYPAFPYDTATWGDGASWRLGHWLNGRIAGAPLADVVARLFGDYAFDRYKAGAIGGVVPGYAIDRIMSAREALQPLELAYFFDTLETEGRIVFRARGVDGPVAAFDDDHLVERTREPSPLTITRTEESELPLAAKIAYVAATQDYRPAIAEARRLTGAAGRVAQADLPVVLDGEDAAAIAETFLFEAWAARERASFALPPSRIAIEPGDIVTLTAGGRQRSFRVREVGEHGEREIEALSIDAEVYARSPTMNRTGRLLPPPLAGQPLAEFLDLPLLRGDESQHAGYVAAVQRPWPGAIAFYSSPEESGFDLEALATAPAVMGTLLEPLPAGPVGRMDRANRIVVALDGGEVLSVTHLKLLGGANVAAIRNADGDWEVVQFETAELSAPQTYALSGVLRGLAGTERAMRSPLAAGARFVLLDGALARIDLAPGEVGLALNWRIGPAARDLGTDTYVARQHTFRGIGMRPLAPVHVRGERSGGDLTITWVRRTRIGGDSWDGVEVPLGEDSERYEIDILDGGDVRRTLTATTPSAVYTAAEQIADFGAPASSVSIRVYQIGAVWGRGEPADATV